MRPNRFVRVVVCAFMRKAPRRPGRRGTRLEICSLRIVLKKHLPPRWMPTRLGETHNPSLLGRRTLPPRSANPPSSVGEPSLLGRRTLPPRSANPPSSVGFDPAFAVTCFRDDGACSEGRPTAFGFAGGGGGADRWSRGNAQERRRTRKMQKIICENIDKIR